MTHEKVSDCTKGQAGGAISNKWSREESEFGGKTCAVFQFEIGSALILVAFLSVSFFFSKLQEKVCFPLSLMLAYWSPKQTKEDRKGFFFFLVSHIFSLFQIAAAFSLGQT